MIRDLVREITETHPHENGDLISILEQVQAQFGYLSPEALRAVADVTDRPLVDVYGVATFYRSFSLEPRGKHVISACLGTACHVRGARAVVQTFQEQLGIRPGQTTDDGEFTLETVNCLGACALGPIVSVDGRYFAKVGRADVARILNDVRDGRKNPERPSEPFVLPLDATCPLCGADLVDPGHEVEGHPSILLRGSTDGVAGWVRLSGVYGSATMDVGFDGDSDALMRLSCPHCHGDLRRLPDCPECAAAMAAVAVSGSGLFSICCRRSCDARLLDLSPLARPDARTLLQHQDERTRSRMRARCVHA